MLRFGFEGEYVIFTDKDGEASGFSSRLALVNIQKSVRRTVRRGVRRWMKKTIVTAFHPQRRRWAWKMKGPLLLSCLKRKIEQRENIVLDGSRFKLQKVFDAEWEKVLYDKYGTGRFAGEGPFRPVPFGFDERRLGGIYVIEEFGDLQAITTGGVSYNIQVSSVLLVYNLKLLLQHKTGIPGYEQQVLQDFTVFRDLDHVNLRGGHLTLVRCKQEQRS